ncbi:MAG: hypothetical protein ACREXT_01270 [Gammaproteobacteria bacterium]
MSVVSVIAPVIAALPTVFVPVAAMMPVPPVPGVPVMLIFAAPVDVTALEAPIDTPWGPLTSNPPPPVPVIVMSPLTLVTCAAKSPTPVLSTPPLAPVPFSVMVEPRLVFSDSMTLFAIWMPSLLPALTVPPPPAVS